MKKLKLILLLVILGWCQLSCAQQYPVAILRGDYADPSIMRDGKDYYMTHSPFTYSPGFLIWHSTDLIHWEPVVRAMNELVGSAMAPDLLKYRDTFYLYFPAEGTNWVIWATNIRGPWSKPIDLKISNIDPGDPGHAVGEDGKRYLFLSGGHRVQLSDDGLSAAGKMEKVYDGWNFPKEWVTEGKWLESPKLFKKGAYYYLTCAEGGTAGPPTSHMVVSARSKSINGPWINSPYNPIVHTYDSTDHWLSKGHGTLIDDINGNWWIVYHAYENGFYTLGRQTLIEPIEWTKDGWFQAAKQRPFLKNDGSIKTTGFTSLSDNFDESRLGLQWTSWMGYDSSKIQVRDGSLFMQGKGASPADAQLLLITATDSIYELQTEVTVSDGSVGGLVLFYNEKAFAGIASDGKKFTVYESADKQNTTADSFGNHFYLKIINDKNRCSFLSSADGLEWTKLQSGIDVSAMHHNVYHGFFALRPGLLAAGKEEVKFEDFMYKSPNSIGKNGDTSSKAGILAPKPAFRDPVYDGAADPMVIWNPLASKWWMFYTNRRANISK